MIKYQTAFFKFFTDSEVVYKILLYMTTTMMIDDDDDWRRTTIDVRKPGDVREKRWIDMILQYRRGSTVQYSRTRDGESSIEPQL